MTVQELLDELEDLDPDMEVRIAHQPQWAFEYSIGTVAVSDPHEAYEVLRLDDNPEAWGIVDSADGEHLSSQGVFETYEQALDAIAKMAEEHVRILYIAEGSQLGYLPAIAKAAVGW